MKHLLENLRKELDCCETEHDQACGALECHSHDDPAMVHMWRVQSANTELLVALAEAVLHHLEMHHGHTGGHMPMSATSFKNV